MGRRTWDSIGRALPDRQNIVVTRQRGVPRSRSRDRAFAAPMHSRACGVPAPAFCIGGGAALSRRAAARDDAVPDRDRSRVRGRHDLSRVRPQRLARGRARAASTADGLAYAFVTYGARNSRSPSRSPRKGAAHVRRSFPRPRPARSRGRACRALGRPVRRPHRGDDGDLRDDRRALRLHGRRHAERRAALQERGRDQEDRSLRPVELLSGEEQQAEPRGARLDAHDGRAAGEAT